MTVLCSIVAMIVAAVAIVLVAGPHVGATSVEGDTLIFDDWDDYDIDSDGVLHGLSDDAYREFERNNIVTGSWLFDGDVQKVLYKIPEGVKKITWGQGFPYYGGSTNNLFIELPTTLEEIEPYCPGFDNTTITIPEKITSLNGVFGVYGWYNLTEIIVQNEALLDDEYLLEYKNFYNRSVAVRYVAPTYAVTFDVAGGSAVENQTIKKGEKATKPTDPTKTGYNFLGWFNGEEEYDFDSAVNGKITLTAKWEESATQTEQPKVETPKNDDKGAFIAAVAGISAGVVGLGVIATIITVVVKRRHK